MTKEELDVRVACTKQIIDAVINNSDVYKFTQEAKENYLNLSWQIINRFIKDNKGDQE